MQEKVARNQSLYEYHLKHPHTGCTKMGRVFKLSPSAVWRILNREKKRKMSVSIDDSARIDILQLDNPTSKEPVEVK